MTLPHTSQHISHRHIAAAGALLMLDGALFGFTNAGQVPSFMVFVGFILLVLTIYFGISLLLSLGQLYGLKMQHKRGLAIYLTGVTGSLVALRSIGELSSRDVLVLLPLAVIGYAYSVYARADRRNLAA